MALRHSFSGAFFRSTAVQRLFFSIWARSGLPEAQKAAPAGLTEPHGKPRDRGKPPQKKSVPRPGFHNSPLHPAPVCGILRGRIACHYNGRKTMKHRYTALTGIVLGAALLLSAIGCTGAPAGSGNAPSAQETQPAAPEPDTRQLTDTTAYKARLSNSFEGIEPATAAELTFTADADGVTITGYTGGATVLVIPAELDGKPVVAVGEGAFRGAAVRALSLPDSLRRIGFGALEKCRELVTLRTPLLCADGKDWFASLFGADSYMSGATAVPAKRLR